MTFRDALRRAIAVPADDKVLCLLDHLVSATGGRFHPTLPGPVFDLADGRSVAFDTWEQWDEAIRRGWMEVADRDGVTLAAITWEGRERLNAWHKKGGRAG